MVPPCVESFPEFITIGVADPYPGILIGGYIYSAAGGVGVCVCVCVLGHVK